MIFRELRFPCSFPAELLVNGSSVPVTIVNVSQRGVRIAQASGLQVGRPVRLRILGQLHDATVRWAAKGLAGLRFQQVLGPSMIAAIRKAAGARVARTGWNLQLRELGPRQDGPATRPRVDPGSGEAHIRST